jgi:hypothetical protein
VNTWEHNGFTEAEARGILQAFNGVMDDGEYSSYRDFLLSMVGDLADGLDVLEEEVRAGRVLVDKASSVADLSNERSAYQQLCEKIVKLNEGKAREIVGFAHGFWAGYRIGAGQA